MTSEEIINPTLSNSLNSHTKTFEKLTLSNGIKLLLAENHSLPAISFNAIVKFGERYIDETSAGLASLLGDLLDEGTSRHNSNEIALLIEEMGARWGTFGGFSNSGVSFTSLKSDFSKLLQMSSEVLTDAIFPIERIEQSKNRCLAQLKSRQDSAKSVALDIFNDLIYEAHPSHRLSLGYPHSVQNITQSQLLENYNKYFVPNNATFSIVGDFSTSELKQQLEEIFGHWQPSNQLSFPSIPNVERQNTPRQKSAINDKEQIHIFMGHLGIKRNNPDYYALLVMDTILGSSPGMTSRIPRILRDELGLAYTTYANITGSAGIDLGKFVAYIGTSPENRNKAIQSLQTEIKRIGDEPVEISELDLAKSYLTGSFVFNFETNAQMAAFLIQEEIFNLGSNYLEQYPNLINQITIEEVQRVSQKYLDSENMTTVIVGPENN